jgi:predicted nucleic acid-binding protein
MPLLRIYLDNDIASAITRLDLAPIELDAIEWLIAAHHASAVILGTSNHAKREIERAPAQYREGLKRGLTGLAYFEKDHRVLGSFTLNTGRGCITNPIVTDIVDDAMHAELLTTGLKTDDAQHFSNAIHSGCDVLLTRDGPFLSRREALAKKYSTIRIRKPSELADELKGVQTKSAGQP